MFTVEVKGADQIKNLFKDIGVELTASQFRQTLDGAGRMIVAEAKQQEEYPGQLGEAFKKDLGVYRDNRKSARNAEFILIGPRFKHYIINGKSKKVATIAQHFTEGFQQTDRLTKAGQSRGRVKQQLLNPVLGAFNAKKGQLDAGIRKGVLSVVKKIKAKYAV